MDCTVIGEGADIREGKAVSGCRGRVINAYLKNEKTDDRPSGTPQIA